MRKLILTLVLVGLFAGPTAAVSYRFSVDIGGNEDLSDPHDHTTEWLDCGDIYLEGANDQTPPPTLVKDDTHPGVYPGYPFIAAPQPAPALIGSGPIGTDPSDQYLDYFDLDAEDQLAFEVYPLSGQDPIPVGQNWGGVHLEPTQIDFSYEDDGPAGWYISPGDVPTTVAPSHGSRATKDEIMVDTGPFGQWSPSTVTGVRAENALGFNSTPPDDYDDEDVDALDKEEHRYFYWSPDHEASMGLDPGSIYMTDLLLPGQNDAFKAIDDVMNLGIPEDTDVDAWEFCAVDAETYMDMFGDVPGSPIVLIGLFSVDADDPDTAAVESGGLDPKTIYASNLVGMSVGLATYDEDIDALTVPEPATLGLLLIGGLAVLKKKF